MCLLQMVICVKTTKATKTVLCKTGAVQVSIPSCIPDLNPIENAFNLVTKKSGSDEVKHSISKDGYEKYVERAENILLSHPIKSVDDIIQSMPKRIAQVIQSKRHRLKY